jgi:hypothetical protein
LNHTVQPPHPNVSEKVAREALLQHVKNQWCYGDSAAKNMAITKLKYTSAFHVSPSVHITFVFFLRNSTIHLALNCFIRTFDYINVE